MAEKFVSFLCLFHSAVQLKIMNIIKILFINCEMKITNNIRDTKYYSKFEILNNVILYLALYLIH